MLLSQRWDVHFRALDSRTWDPDLHRRRIVAHWRIGLSERTTSVDIAFQRKLLCWRSSRGWDYIWYTSTSSIKLVMESPFAAPSSAVTCADLLNLVSMWSRTVCCFRLTSISFVPESPRWLISKDRREEAFEILVKYHAEGDRNSVLVAAEFAQIESTIKIELENSKMSWADMFRTTAMRKRVLIGSLLGLFTQWSGNTLISYYLSTILDQIGYTDANFQGKLNVSKNCWELVNATIASFLVRRFARRKMYLTCTISLLFVYCGWTIAQQQTVTTGSTAAGKAVIFFIFAYSPCYNIGYNALTYSKCRTNVDFFAVTD